METAIGLSLAAVLAAAVFKRFQKSHKEGFVVVPTETYPVTADQGRELYNPLTLASDPRVQTERLAAQPLAQQQAFKQALDSATATPTTALDAEGTLQVQSTATAYPTYIPNDESLFLRVAYCEKRVAAVGAAAALADPKFAKECGVCLSSGTKNDGSTFTGEQGLFMNPDDRSAAAATADLTASPPRYSGAKPTLGSCAGEYAYAISPDEYRLFSKRRSCQSGKILDGECATCLQDGSYTYVGKTAPLHSATFYVAGVGTLIARFAAGVRPPITLSPTPQPIRVTLAEDDTLVFNVQKTDPTVDAELYGVLDVTATSGGTIQIPIEKILLVDDVLAGKPRRGRDFPTVQTPAGPVSCARMLSGYGKPSMVLSGNLPFLLAETFPFEGVDCKNSLLQQKGASVERFGADPCYKPSSQAAGSWSDACLRDRIAAVGCTEAGDLYKDPAPLRGSTLAEIQRTLQSLSAVQYTDAVASKKCNGRDIRTPCDAYTAFDVNNTPDISPQCMDFLYKNGGADLPAIGPTYTGPVATYYSLDATGNKLYCSLNSAYNPSTHPDLVRKLQADSRSGNGTGKIGIPYIQQFFNAAYQRSTNTGLSANLPDSDGGRATSIGNCYSPLAQDPPPTSGLHYPRGRYVTVSYPGGRTDILQLSQLVVLDEKQQNVSRGKATTSRNGTGAAAAVDGTESTRGPPNLYLSLGKDRDFWRVDLGQVYSISRIVYYNRGDCCQSRSGGVQIMIFATDPDRSPAGPVWTTQLVGGRPVETFSTVAPSKYNI